MDDISSGLSDLLEDRKLMLTQCTRLCTDHKSTCQCRLKLKQAKKDIQILRQKCTALENKCSKDEDTTKVLTQEISMLNKHIETIKRALQTDDVKISAGHNNEPCEELGETNVDKHPNTFDTVVKSEDSTRTTVRGSSKAMSTQLETQGARSKNTRKDSIDEKFLTCTTTRPEVIRQEERRTLLGDHHWREVAQDELDIGRTLFRGLGGFHTILCLDISESILENNGWEKTTTFVKDYLIGLRELSDTQGFDREHVAIVTFGHETVVKQRFSNTYTDLIKVIDDVQLGGPSTLYGGILMALAAARSSSFKAVKCSRHCISGPRIVIITDGRPSDIRIIAGRDTCTANSDEDMTRRYILDVITEFIENDYIIVPVGNVDTDFLDTMIGVSGGIKMDYTQGRRFSRRSYLSKFAGKHHDHLSMLLDLNFDVTVMMERQQLTYEDREDISSIEERSVRLKEILKTKSKPDMPDEDPYYEKQRSNLPTVGSRVRRGPDWKWGDQDKQGPGTVVGHSKETDGVYVTWDISSAMGYYRYGEKGYDVLIVDETRELNDINMLEIGCMVKPGKRWKAMGPKPRRGVVIKFESGKATVRWDNGRRGQFNRNLKDGDLVHCMESNSHLHDASADIIAESSDDTFLE